jgi:hypothetical protein
MSKQLYEEALADAKKVREIAEENAKRAILDAVAPRIKDLIERELLQEVGVTGDEVLLDLGSPDAVEAVEPPDEDGKVTLDLDALTSDPTEPAETKSTDYALNAESIEALSTVGGATRESLHRAFELKLYKFGDELAGIRETALKGVDSQLRTQIAQMISRVEDMYGYVQESITDSKRKSDLETRLETYFRDLNNLQEKKMSLKDLITEEDMDVGSAAPSGGGELTLKLTGLPDDVDLEAIGVDLVSSEESEAAPEAEEPSGEEPGDEELDLGDLDLSGEEEEGEDSSKFEVSQLSDDTIVEIDLNEIAAEIAKMKRVNEEAVPPPRGVDKSVLDDFGGGSDDGDPWLDGEVTTESDSCDEEEMPEATAVEGDEMDEVDELEELQNRRKGEERGSKVADGHYSFEGKAAFEKKLQENLRGKLRTLRKTDTSESRAQRVTLLRRLGESVKRLSKLENLSEGSTSQKKGHSNSTQSRPAEEKAVSTLREKLAEESLRSEKLLYANKVLQNESMTKRQKAAALERLDEAATPREVKLTYESIAKTIGGSRKTIVESKDKVVGSSSRATRPASTVLTEGFETSRWAQMAGLKPTK